MTATGRVRRHDDSRDALAVLNAVMALAGSYARLLVHSERPWHSATFSGFRLCPTFCFEGEEAVAAGEAFIARLDEAEIRLPRLLVVDISLAYASREMVPVCRLTVQVELLLLWNDGGVG